MAAASDFPQRLDVIYKSLRANLKTSSRNYDWRIAQLKALRRMLVENDSAICSAMFADLHKSRFECVETEQGIVLSEIEDALKNLSSWMKTRKVHTPLYNMPGSCQIRHDPYGLVLIIGAWNYPINLLLAPLVGAIAGGNAVLLKPSELAVQTAKLLTILIPKYMDKNLIQIIEAGPEETSELLDKVFDLIFFTGSGPVGKIVMGKAAKNLTPVVLELGGKSPAVVLEDADIDVAARRLTWGKFMNAGQTCVSPDHILVQPKLKKKLISEIQKNILQFFGEDAKQSADYCRIVNRKNFDRLVGFMKGQKIIFGGASDADSLFIAPTLIESRLTDPVMEQEIFGPILPIIEMADVDEMIEFITSRPHPLALYVFTKDKEAQEKILKQTRSGGVCINDVIMQMPVPELPFGGVGASGMGHYHGEYSFKTFTHAKGVLRKATWIDIPVRYAPYNMRNLKILRWMF
jgi:aldehyde dehydrogenase (NAD+)